MKSFVKRLGCTVFAVALISSLICVSASIYSSQYLDSYRATLTPKSGGRIVVSADVAGRGSQEVIGVTKVIIYESTDNKSFYQVETYESDDYPNMLSSGSFYTKDVLTHYGTPGYYYMASVYCYAGDGTDGTERNYVTASKRAIS